MNQSRHILTSFDTALNQLRQDLFKMSTLSTQGFHNAVKGLLHRDADLLNQVIAEDELVDQLEKSIDADGIAILTRFTPMAEDLRRVVSTMKASSNLERISDQAVSIARRGRRLMQHQELPEVKLLEALSHMAMQLLEDSVQSFIDNHLELATGLKSRDRELDKMQNDFIVQITRRMEEDPNRIKDYIDLVFIARFLERIGDHAVNIGEDAVYASVAKDIRHLHS